MPGSATRPATLLRALLVVSAPAAATGRRLRSRYRRATAGGEP
ncbi:hypothetical protein [Streptomyces venezuelae]|nr:hypothetical protein [Streptomyces venezuelae]